MARMRYIPVLVFLTAIAAGVFTAGMVRAEDGMKKVLMVIAADGFRDEEFLQPKEIFEQNGMQVTVTSSTQGFARSMMGVQVRTDLRIDAVKASDYDAVVFVGGEGAQEYWDDPEAHAVARQAFSGNKIVAAICIAPVTLARAGLLKNKKATVWESEENEITGPGARYTAQPVERDGRIITASGPDASKEFGQAIVKALKE